ncbi:UNVERIFIED_CONTAM: hypothetical protein Sangu_1014800 [Sesamum angustifolium]|uniref:DUF4218 domain-containing protein n=1 Tax=Sesamum angustifolium TaxID=2727405 RepID=A0AAW2PDY3_9LAMI
MNMNIEKNIFDSVFNTVMNIKEKTKDNLNAQKDLKIIYYRLELEADERRPNVIPKAELRMHNMKSHNFRVFMYKLISIAFREMLPEHVWSMLTEVSLLFQILCSTMLDLNKLQELEARMKMPVEYWWMYPFERVLRDLKMKVKNKAHIEASIVEANLVEEISLFTSHYFEPHILCKQNMPRRMTTHDE